MQRPIDSLTIYKHYVDSLVNMQKLHEPSFIRWDQPPVQAAIIVSLTTICTVVLGFMFKDFWIPRWLQKRTKKATGQDLFATYKLNLARASVNLLYRLREIYHSRSHYLWNENPIQPFYEYKYKSSVYRLCVLLGWIRAYRLLESSMIINGTDGEFHKISEVINRVESALADGQRVEMYVAKALCMVAKVDTASLPKTTMEKFSIEIDHAVQQFLHNGSKKSIRDLDGEGISNFVDHLQALMDKLGINGSNLKDCQDDVVREVSIVLGLIYRDWQHALGDLMLVKDKDNKDYHVRSYRSFEEIWDTTNSSDKKWLQRAETMFGNLDLRVPEKSDSRIEQLKLVYKEVYQLVKILQETAVGKNAVSSSEFKKILSEVDILKY